MNRPGSAPETGAEHADVVVGPNALAELMEAPDFRGPMQAVLQRNEGGKLGADPSRLFPGYANANNS